MATKKFKTVSGYLRSSMPASWDYKLKGDELKAAIKADQRRVLNNLLPQLQLPTLDNTEEALIDGVKRLLAAGGTEHQVKALKDCARWLKNYRIITITVHPQVKTADGLVSYKVQGFKHADHNVRVTAIVDVKDGENTFARAETIFGSDYCFHSSMNLTELVNDDAKNRLFFSDEKLYAAAPELRPAQSVARAKKPPLTDADRHQ